jgi:hypothetical protein
VETYLQWLRRQLDASPATATTRERLAQLQDRATRVDEQIAEQREILATTTKTAMRKLLQPREVALLRNAPDRLAPLLTQRADVQRDLDNARAELSEQEAAETRRIFDGLSPAHRRAVEAIDDASLALEAALNAETAFRADS